MQRLEKLTHHSSSVGDAREAHDATFWQCVAGDCARHLDSWLGVRSDELEDVHVTGACCVSAARDETPVSIAERRSII